MNFVVLSADFGECLAYFVKWDGAATLNDWILKKAEFRWVKEFLENPLPSQTNRANRVGSEFCQLICKLIIAWDVWLCSIKCSLLWKKRRRFVSTARNHGQYFMIYITCRLIYITVAVLTTNDVWFVECHLWCIILTTFVTTAFRNTVTHWNGCLRKKNQRNDFE